MAEKVTAEELRNELVALRKEIEALKAKSGGLTDEERKGLQTLRADVAALREQIGGLDVVSTEDVQAALRETTETAVCPKCNFPDLRGVEQSCPSCGTALEWEE